MATRMVSLTDFGGGINTDDYRAPRTAKVINDLLPHRGFLRRRGPAKVSQAGVSFEYKFSDGTTRRRLIWNAEDLDIPISFDSLPDAGEIACYGSTSNEAWNGTTGSGTATTNRVSFMGRPEGASTFSQLYCPMFNGDDAGLPSTWLMDYDKFPKRWIPVADGEYIGFHSSPVSLGNDSCTMVRWGGNATSGMVDSGSGDDCDEMFCYGTSGTKVLKFKNSSAVNCNPPSFLAAGQYIAADDKFYKIAFVAATKILLDSPLIRTLGAEPFRVHDVAPLNVSAVSTSGAAKFGQVRNDAGTFIGQNRWGNSPSACAATFHQGRLFLGNFFEGQYVETGQTELYERQFGYRIRWSGLPGEVDTDGFKGIENFHDDAYLDLGVSGGKIKALVSFNDQLVVLRARSVEVIVGGFATDGADLGADLNLVSASIGCANAYTWDVCERGVVFSDEKGCYLYDGRSIQNLTKGRIENAWRHTPGKQISVCNDRIIVTRDQTPSRSYYTNLHYLFANDAWFQFASDGIIGRVGAVSDTSETYAKTLDGAAVKTFEVEDLGGHYDMTTNSGAAGRDTDNGRTDFPSPGIYTQPIPMVDGVMPGRVSDVVLMHGGSNVDSISIQGYACGPYAAGDIDESAAFTDVACLLPSPPTLAMGSASGVMRTHQIRALSSNECAYIMLILSANAGGVADFSYTLCGIGVVVESEDRFTV